VPGGCDGPASSAAACASVGSIVAARGGAGLASSSARSVDVSDPVGASGCAQKAVRLPWSAEAAWKIKRQLGQFLGRGEEGRALAADADFEAPKNPALTPC